MKLKNAGWYILALIIAAILVLTFLGTIEKSPNGLKVHELRTLMTKGAVIEIEAYLIRLRPAKINFRAWSEYLKSEISRYQVSVIPDMIKENDTEGVDRSRRLVVEHQQRQQRLDRTARSYEKIDQLLLDIIEKRKLDQDINLDPEYAEDISVVAQTLAKLAFLEPTPHINFSDSGK